ncbi:MAG: hypothetical protein KF911_03715 [Pseudomonadales bacterium]|nr:hypothetical protein [Pseudomonadales bacterium]
MKINSFLLTTALLFVAGGAAHADLTPLTDEQLGGVTAGSAMDPHGPGGPAGSAAGGVAVANASEARIENDDSLTLDSDAQSGARGVNIVNTTASLVAQGANVWDAQFAGDAMADMAVDQSNLVMQSQSTRAATLDGYRREANELEVSGLATTTRNLDTIDLVSEVNVETNHQLLGQSVNLGLGVGVAGRVGIDVDAASIDFGISASSRFETDVGVNGTINLPRPFGTMHANGQLISTIENEGAVELSVDTPPISIDAIGSVCYSKLGTCVATADDNSTYQTDITHDESLHRERHGALDLQGVQAEYVVIDDSSLELVNGRTLTLASGAQSNLAAVNAVNAVGSLVSNGVNVARTRADGAASTPASLTQRNVVIQNF